MNFEQFDVLGDLIRDRYRKASFNEQDFPEIATDALNRADVDREFRLDQLADFLTTTKIKQQPGLAFSNLPPIVFHCAEFYIELLVWMDATTSIHQHAFSGAFRVLEGSSVHSVYTFEERERVSTRLLLGDMRLEMAEVLRAGDVRTIRSGREGLTHALFHLERPSVTIVVRTHSEPWANPQYSFAPPAIAYDPFDLGADQTVRLFRRLLNVANGLDPAHAVELLVTKGVLLDFSRLFMVVSENYRYLSQEQDWERFMDAAREIHGPRAEHLADGVKSAKRESSLISTRNEVKDPELRFFLALLLNLPARSWIYRLIEQNYPGRSPHDLCCQWLKQLREQERLSGVFVELARKAGLGSDMFRARLNAAVPFERTDRRSDAFLEAALTGANAEDFSLLVKNTIMDGVEPRVLDGYAQLRRMAELAPLFAD